jgi:hypothetical protein
VCKYVIGHGLSPFSFNIMMCSSAACLRKNICIFQIYNANLKSQGSFVTNIYVYTDTYIESYASGLLFYIFVMLFSIYLGTNNFISGPHIR